MHEQVEKAGAGYAELAGPEQPRWVTEQTHRTSETLSEIEKSWDRLTERLAPILAPDSPHAMLSDKADTSTRSPLADELARTGDRLVTLHERIHRLEGRLEI